MKKTTVKDLTTGSPTRLILGFFFPLVLGLLFQQFYSMVDTVIVGKVLGVNALAGVGSTGSVNFFGAGLLHRRVYRLCDSRGPEVRREGR